MHKYSKILIASSLFISAIFALNKREPGWSALLLFLSIVVVFLFFKNEYLLLAFFKARKQDIKGLGKWLAYIKNPEYQLIKSQQAYYYFLSGIFTSKSNIRQSEIYMKKALEIGLTFNHDKAIAKLNLSAAALTKGRKREAEILLSEAKRFDGAGLLIQEIRIMKEHIKKNNSRRFYDLNIFQARKYF